MGLLRFVVAAAVLLTSAAAHATTVGPLTELVAGPTTANQRAPVIAWSASANNYVIVWEDGRSATNGTDLYAARIDANGARLAADANGCPVLTNAARLPGNETEPAVADLGGGLLAIAWTEAPSGLADIFAARFQVSTCSPFAPVQVSSGGDIESQPDITSSPQGVLVVWQANLVAGSQVVRGRRLQSDLSAADAVSTTLSASGAGRPAASALGNQYIVGWGAAGDVFARPVPVTGPIAPPNPTTVSNAALNQSRLDLAPLGANFVAVWQDARAGTGNEDVYGRRLTPAAVALGAERPVSTAAADQLTPVVAGDASRGLSVWQDRRNGSVTAIVYGARLDPATGGPLDPRGLPVLALPGNAFEPTIAKGPGADYLVAAVRFGGVSRIYYRLVRDEPPAGALTASGGGTGVSDNATPVNVTFSGASGASGLPVIDGTLYTVTLSAPTAGVSQPDADALAPGHQIAASGGQLLVGVVSSAPGAVTVSVASVEGTSTGSAQVTFTNSPPQASQVVVGPAGASSLVDIQLSYVYADPEGDPEAGTLIQWTRNAAVQPMYADMTLVPASATRRGDQWRARVIPSDGQSQGTPVFSNTLTIGNAPPTATGVAITPDTDVRSGTALTGRYSYSDMDLDPEMGTTTVWVLDGAPQSNLTNTNRVPGSRVRKGQSWRYAVTPNDGLAAGPEVRSDAVTIVNTAPIARAGPDAEVPERGRHTLDGSGSSDQDPQDTLQFSWTQLMVGDEPRVGLSSTSSPTPSFEAPSVERDQVLTFELTVSDGEELSGASRVRVTVVAATDADNDGLDDLQEMQAGTDPNRADTDTDGLRDGAEVALGTDPLDIDSDDDGVRDGAEGRSCPTCMDFEPDADPDGDMLVAALDPDTDNDGVLDGTELSVREPLVGGGTAPYTFEGTDEGAGRFTADLDPDSSTDPLRADTDGDSLDDGLEDRNANGRIDDGETDPNDPEDPPVSCGDGNPCPGDLTCVDGLCRDTTPADGGANGCDPIPETVECCMGGCDVGSPVEPICLEPGARETCPVGAELCVTGACSDTTPFQPSPAEPSGCQGVGGSGPSLLLALLGPLALRRPRRRTVSRVVTGSI